MSEHPLDVLRDRLSRDGWLDDPDDNGQTLAALLAVEQLEQAARPLIERTQQPVDLNYVAVLKDDWEVLRAALALFDRKEQT